MKIMLWLDDVRTPVCAPDTKAIWCKSVNEAIRMYSLWGSNLDDKDVCLTEINLDHDAGDYAKDGGDYIRFLDWMERIHSEDFPKISWKIHSMNPVGVDNMLRILRRNGAKI